MINGRIVINLAGNKYIYMSYFHTHETSCQVEVECIYIQTKSNFLSAPYMLYTMLLCSFYECRLRRAKRAELKFFSDDSDVILAGTFVAIFDSI